MFYPMILTIFYFFARVLFFESILYARKYRDWKRKNLSERDAKDIFSWKNFKYKMNKIFQSLWIICVYNMYSRIVMNSFSILKCITIDDSKNTYLEKLPDVVCWESSEHKVLLLGIFIPSLSVWCIAWPLFLLRNLIIKKKIILNSANSRILDSPLSTKKVGILEINTKLEQNPDFLRELEVLEDTHYIYKYLTLDYIPSAYYWEFYFYITNFIVSSLIYTTSSLHPVSQSSLIILTFVIMMLFSRIKSPFKLAVANDLQVLYLKIFIK